MKILHCADIHLGSKIEAKFPKEKSNERRAELRASFSRMIDYAKDNDIKAVLLVGDVFDSDRPLKKDKEFFYSVIRRNPDIDFLYLRGNHDIMESYTEYDLENLKLFSETWQTYTYENVAITGIELCAENARSFYSSLVPDKTKTNIVLLHGQISESEGVGKIKLAKLKNKNIDYLALGHVHYFSEGKLDARGAYVYSGCLEGRGFDEIGEKGFVEIDIGQEVTYTFVKNSYRVFDEIAVDITDTQDVYSACRKVKGFVKSKREDILRIVLMGEVSYDCSDIEKEVEKQLERDYYFVHVKSKVMQKFDIEKLSGDISLKGEFLRTVLQCDEHTNDEKQNIISIGLRALDGREAD